MRIHQVLREGKNRIFKIGIDKYKGHGVVVGHYYDGMNKRDIQRKWRKKIYGEVKKIKEKINTGTDLYFFVVRK